MTANEELGADLSDLFNLLTGYSRKTKYRSLIVAPYGMREHLIDLIHAEGRRSTPKRPGKISMKVNSLVDEEVIEALYEASRAGVEIDLIVRSICSLRPGVPGLSDNIRVRSIVGRFLEHSRIYYFRNGTGGEFYLGSADAMPRNLDRRVEALVKVESRNIRRDLKRILETNLADNTGSWSLGPDGEWSRLCPGPDERPQNAQSQFMSRARARSRRHV
jgi:polyphosphate kinase